MSDPISGGELKPLEGLGEGWPNDTFKTMSLHMQKPAWDGAAGGFEVC